MPKSSKVPVPKFDMITPDEQVALRAKTVLVDPETGLSIETVKKTYAEIVKDGSPVFCTYEPSQEDIVRFTRSNPNFKFVKNNVYCERNPLEKDLKDESHISCTLPEARELFHDVNNTILRDN